MVYVYKRKPESLKLENPKYLLLIPDAQTDFFRWRGRINLVVQKVQHASMKDIFLLFHMMIMRELQ